MIMINCDFGVGFRISNKLSLLEKKGILPKSKYIEDDKSEEGIKAINSHYYKSLYCINGRNGNNERKGRSGKSEAFSAQSDLRLNPFVPRPKA